MLNVKQCLKDVLFRFGLIADYVVEYGIEGIWSYEKWASGKATCEGTVISSHTFTNKTGNVCNYQVTVTSFPSGLFNSAPRVWANMKNWAPGWAQAIRITKNSFYLSEFYATEYTEVADWNTDVLVIGTWK